MNILHICKPYGGENDDEGAIAFAFEKLGHKVYRMDERNFVNYPRSEEFDFALCHHHPYPSRLKDLKCPMLFWYFDRVEQLEASLRQRSEDRRIWIERMTSICHMGFCTDGDYVAQDKSGKLHWLMQGADERIYKSTLDLSPTSLSIDLLFAGARGHGVPREKQLDAVKDKFPGKMKVIENRFRVYREAFADVLRSTRICIAPAYPVSDRYWSNRVYVVTSLGGFLLHPWTKGIEEQYGSDLITYRDQEELYSLIDYWLDDSEEVESERERMVMCGRMRTLRDHLYRHRCEVILKLFKQSMEG